MQSQQIQSDAAAASSLQNNFNLKALSTQFQGKSIAERLDFIASWTAEHLPENLALTSSFGVQSALMLHYAHASNLNIPVVSVDIAGEKYAPQRAYRTQLKEKLGFPLLTFAAESEDKKVHAMTDGLRANFISATIAGIRSSQTENRAAKDFVEWNARNGTLSFHPLLDWPDAKADHYLQMHIPPELRHPDYHPGVRSQGGVILDAQEAKSECGLHLP